MLRQYFATAALSATSFAAPPAIALGVTAPDPAPPGFDVPAALHAAASAADCPIDPRDLAAIQQREAPSTVVSPDGTASNPDGSPIRGDNGRSLGPFQFNLDGGAWTVYGHGSPDNYTEAAAATARMLCANNYASDRMAAIARHNGSGPAAREYAVAVDAAARGMAPVPTADPSLAVDDNVGGCAASDGSRYALGAVVDRLWCNAIVKPWLALSNSGTHHEQWAAADRWLFGPDAGPRPGGPLPTGTRSAAGVTCPVTTGLAVGDGWGAARSGGRSHQGIDIFGDMGSPAVAPFAGTVTDANSDEGAGGLGGRSVTIRASGGQWDGDEVYMAHLEAVSVSVGQSVREGETVGTVGNSGNARGGDPHVHLQLHPGGGAPVSVDATVGTACGGGPQP